MLWIVITLLLLSPAVLVPTLVAPRQCHSDLTTMGVRLPDVVDGHAATPANAQSAQRIGAGRPTRLRPGRDPLTAIS